MFVRVFEPSAKQHSYPIVFWHGAGQSEGTYLSTPDGRQGWAQFFADRGYIVNVITQPSQHSSAISRETESGIKEFWSRRFTAPELHSEYPQAPLHNQWPGLGVPGDPIFELFFASRTRLPVSWKAAEETNVAAGIALLEKIGPAILVTHSQSGAFGWALADARPHLIKAIIAVEPNGPPFRDTRLVGPPRWFDDGPVARPWGITRTRLTYDPPVSDPAELDMTQESKAAGPGLTRCWTQGGRPHTLPNLRGIPIAIVVAEASFHTSYDHCTSKYLQQAEVPHDFVRLADNAIVGNGHMMMLENNNLVISSFLENWIRTQTE